MPTPGGASLIAGLTPITTSRSPHNRGHESGSRQRESHVGFECFVGRSDTDPITPLVYRQGLAKAGCRLLSVLSVIRMKSSLSKHLREHGWFFLGSQQPIPHDFRPDTPTAQSQLELHIHRPGKTQVGQK